ncbi:MAG: potassium transporter TrkG [Acidimicrobiales bacterium]|nr:potassium transporter TrkG [Acidimicrobiales bacterium]
MTTQRAPRISAPRLELRGARPTSYSRLAVAEATAVLGIVSITCGVLGLFDDAGDALFLIGLGLASIAFALLARRTLDRTHRPSPGRVLSGLAFTWLTLVVIGTGVYLATGTIDRVDDAFVESAAGFSTTSLTTLDPSELNVPMQLWRAGTQWIGGLVGIIVGVVSLPLALRGGMLSREGQHARERLAPTPVVGRRRVMLVYGAISTLVGLGYVATGLGARDSLVHTFTTVSTGGFSSKVDSFAGLGAGPRTVATIGMAIGGTSFIVIWWALRGRSASILRSTELRLYLGILAAGSVLLALSGEGMSIGESVFTTVSAASTTGFAVGEWTALSDSVLMVLLVIIGTGSMSASAGGGLRVLRAWTLVGFASRELRRQLDPHSAAVVKQAGEPIDERALERTTGYQIAHLGLCGCAAFLLAIAGTDVLAALYTGISVISTHGPGVGPGAYGSLESFSPPARLLLTPFMLAGRLSILPLLLALSFGFRLENELARRVRRVVRKVFVR